MPAPTVTMLDRNSVTTMVNNLSKTLSAVEGAPLAAAGLDQRAILARLGMTNAGENYRLMIYRQGEGPSAQAIAMIGTVGKDGVFTASKQLLIPNNPSSAQAMQAIATGEFTNVPARTPITIQTGAPARMTPAGQFNPQRITIPEAQQGPTLEAIRRSLEAAAAAAAPPVEARADHDHLPKKPAVRTRQA